MQETIVKLVPLGMAHLVPGIWRTDDHEERIRRMQEFADEATDLLGIEPVSVEYEPSDISRIACGGGYYIPSKRIIAIASTRSVITFLHEFGHHAWPDRGEHDIARWSHDLLKAMAPASYKRAMANGGLFSSGLLDEERES